MAFTRTIRGRYLLAYLVYELLRGRDPRYDELDGLRLLVGDTTFKRLKKLARLIVNKHREALEEVIMNV